MYKIHSDITVTDSRMMVFGIQGGCAEFSVTQKPVAGYIGNGKVINMQLHTSVIVRSEDNILEASRLPVSVNNGNQQGRFCISVSQVYRKKTHKFMRLLF